MQTKVRPFKEVASKVELIRQRKKARERILLENERESLAREFITRAFVLPRFKKIFGNNLLVVAIYGSTQVGVRKATKASHFRKSDLDLVIVLENPTMNARQTRMLGQVEKQCAKLCSIDFFYVTEEVFEKNQESTKEPFQVIYGGKNIEGILGKNFAKDFNENRRQMKRKAKYNL